MKISNTLKIAFKNIVKNKTRSFLTSLGIIIGVGSVIIMVGIGEATQRNIEREIASLGTNLIIVYPGAFRGGGVSQGTGTFNRLSIKDVENIKTYSKFVEAVSPVISSNEQVIGGGNNWRTTVYGVSEDYAEIRDYKLASGVFFTEQDVKAGKNIVVLGKDVADAVFPDDEPVGKSIRISRVPCKVVGVLESKGQGSFQMSQDDLIMMPYTTFQNKINQNRFLRSIDIKSSIKDLSVTQEEIRDILRNSHKLPDSSEDDFRIGNQTEITERATSVASLMTLLLGSIAAVSLVVGGIGIMNIMLVSVTERTREIGIRLAVGARKRDILMQFLIEALVLSVIGGALGILISFMVLLILNNFTNTQMVINYRTIILAVGFSGTIGIFFGFYPARKASKLNPIDALRYE
ncbi:MAG: ABC transporter permease [Spirochaetes bacterium]|nr:ABC transporter permease [Spirochaetota bacterium]